MEKAEEFENEKLKIEFIFKEISDNSNMEKQKKTSKWCIVFIASKLLQFEQVWILVSIERFVDFLPNSLSIHQSSFI